MEEEKELFNTWNTQKQKIQGKMLSKNVSPEEGEVWWCVVGKNLGREQNGSDGDFSRPVLILKKFNSEMFWGVPLTSRQKDLDYYYNFTDPEGNKAAIIIAQIRLLSTKRLKRVLYRLSALDIKTIKLIMIRDVVSSF